jgi:hypothetical protein
MSQASSLQFRWPLLSPTIDRRSPVLQQASERGSPRSKKQVTWAGKSACPFLKAGAIGLRWPCRPAPSGHPCFAPLIGSIARYARFSLRSLNTFPRDSRRLALRCLGSPMRHKAGPSRSFVACAGGWGWVASHLDNSPKLKQFQVASPSSRRRRYDGCLKSVLHLDVPAGRADSSPSSRNTAASTAASSGVTVLWPEGSNRK